MGSNSIKSALLWQPQVHVQWKDPSLVARVCCYQQSHSRCPSANQQASPWLPQPAQLTTSCQSTQAAATAPGKPRLDQSRRPGEPRGSGGLDQRRSGPEAVRGLQGRPTLTLTKVEGNQASCSALRPHHQSSWEASSTRITFPASKASSCSPMVTWSHRASA